jgi:hypothetical protein
MSFALWSLLDAFLSKASLSLASFRYEEIIERFEESDVPWSAAFGIWNPKTVFSAVDLLAMTG